MQELVAIENQHEGIPFLTQITNNFYHIIDLD
jgi:hypothetical protein